MDAPQQLVYCVLVEVLEEICVQFDEILADSQLGQGYEGLLYHRMAALGSHSHHLGCENCQSLLLWTRKGRQPVAFNFFVVACGFEMFVDGPALL